MSYNISRWRTKKLDNLKIPLNSFFKHPRSEYHPKKSYDENGVLTLDFMESTIKGTVKDGILTVSDIEFSGEGSGTVTDWILEPALKESTGELIATCIWEDGDSVNKLIVKDGYYRDNGLCGDSEHEADLVNIPEKIEGWMNVYTNRCTSDLHGSKEIADKYAALDDRVACIKVTFTEGEGL